MPTAPRSSPPPAPEEPAQGEPATTRTEPDPSIVSVHLSRVDDPQLGGLDGLLVIFDVEVDAASLDRRGFVVSRAEAGPVRPQRALLSPASEDDENRSVVLVGEFGDATESGQPTHLAVSGPVFTEGGTSLSGLGAGIEAFDAPPQLVALAVPTPAAGRCEGAAGMVRTYWSDVLRGVEPDDLQRIEVTVGDRLVHPVGFDDHEIAHGESGEDNVLDLCLAEGDPVSSVSVEAGAFQDAAGHPSAAVRLEVANSAPGS